MYEITVFNQDGTTKDKYRSIDKDFAIKSAINMKPKKGSVKVVKVILDTSRIK